jgi:hypothetical protein
MSNKFINTTGINNSIMLKYIILFLTLGCVSCNFFAKNQETISAIPDSSSKRIGVNTPVKILTTDYFALLYGFLSNGGNSTRKKSIMSQLNISLNILKISNDDKAYQSLYENKTNIICVPAHSFARYSSLYQSISPTAFFLTSWSRGEYACVSRKPYSSVKQLKHKKVSCIKNSPEHYVLRFLLQTNNIDEKNVVWHYVTTGKEALQLLQRQGVDFSFVNTSNQSIEINKNMYILFSTEYFSKFIPFILVARERYLVQNQKKIILLLKGFLHGRSLMAQMNNVTPNKLQQELKFLPVHKEKFISLFNLKKYASYNDNRKFFRLSPKANIDHLFLFNTYKNFENLDMSSNIELASQTMHTIPLIKLYKTFRQKRTHYIKYRSKLPDQSSNKFSFFTITLPFKKNEDSISIKNDLQLRYYSLIANSLSNITVEIHPLKNITQEDEHQIYLKRAQAIYTILTRQYNISRNRIIVYRNVQDETTDSSLETLNSSEERRVILEFNTRH